MTRVRGWRAENTRARLYLAIRAAGAVGLSRKAAIQACAGVGESAVDNLLYVLASMGYCMAAKAPGKPGRYTVTAHCNKPVLLYVSLLPVLLDMIDDCEAGVSERVLCDELCIAPELLQRTLKPAIQSLQVERIMIPLAHGGGRGYRATSVTLATALAAAATAAQVYEGAAA